MTIEQKVSIILLTYNQEKFIRKAIESALLQTYKNIELIISNNGSSDNTASIIKSFLHDKRIIFLRFAKIKFVISKNIPWFFRNLMKF